MRTENGRDYIAHPRYSCNDLSIRCFSCLDIGEFVRTLQETILDVIREAEGKLPDQWLAERIEEAIVAYFEVWYKNVEGE
jgi:hypothetical protein